MVFIPICRKGHRDSKKLGDFLSAVPSVRARTEIWAQEALLVIREGVLQGSCQAALLEEQRSELKSGWELLSQSWLGWGEEEKGGHTVK